jgi:hypothetical protein
MTNQSELALFKCLVLTLCIMECQFDNSLEKAYVLLFLEKGI